MNLRHIEIFHAVYTNGSVSGAARALNISQPSVSKALRHAESLLGFPLFERAQGRLIPTEDAHTLFVEVAQIQERVHALREGARNLRRGTGTVLRISALPSLALGVLPEAVARFRLRHTDVRFDLQTVHHDDLVRKLYERETDIALAYEVPHHAPIGSHVLGEGRLAALYREQDIPDAPAHLTLADLRHHPFISVAASGPIGHLLVQEQQRLDMELDDAVSARTFYIATALVRSGVGLTVVDSFTAQASLAPGLATRPLSPMPSFDVHAMFLINRPPTALAKTFLKIVSEVISQT
ncbi:LysR family transcriptional regulator [Sphingomonas turrisvirgatae]|uniref:LysR family transcriptional regulator n=1 Tax=Sphingomonas turrisvirgatae TaxID=1888892 RepID=A0A1E3LT97_9SPHN|nr:LysR substrate-binding domain-containing protein [Sphingomonas turrisvirgatae]ODP36967.1 LysR family transcriptional regulator [Sphingomonas turrisvirgatae]